MSTRAPSLDDAIRRMVREEILIAQRAAAPSWSWVACSALGMSSRAAMRLARSESLKATRIAGRVYLDRGDLDRLAARNLIAPTDGDEGDDNDQAQADLHALARFGCGGSR